MSDYYNPGEIVYDCETERDIIIVPQFQQRAIGTRKVFSIRVADLIRYDVYQDMIKNPRVVLHDLLKLVGITKVSKILKPDLARMAEERFRFIQH